MNAWRLDIPIAPMRRPDPSPTSPAKDPQARLRELAGIAPVKESVGARNDPDYARWKDQVRLYVQAYRPRPMFVDAVLLCATFHCRPHDRIPDALLGLPHKATPDLDRFLHGLADALTLGGVWSDDRLVAASLCLKVWSKDRKHPHIEVLVTPLDPVVVARMLEIAHAGAVTVGADAERSAS